MSPRFYYKFRGAEAIAEPQGRGCSNMVPSRRESYLAVKGRVRDGRHATDAGEGSGAGNAAPGNIAQNLSGSKHGGRTAHVACRTQKAIGGGREELVQRTTLPEVKSIPGQRDLSKNEEFKGRILWREEERVVMRE